MQRLPFLCPEPPRSLLNFLVSQNLTQALFIQGCKLLYALKKDLRARPGQYELWLLCPLRPKECFMSGKDNAALGQTRHVIQPGHQVTIVEGKCLAGVTAKQ
jgi:hypothetical protein